MIAKVEADAFADDLAGVHQRHADRRWRSPTSSTASSSRGCRRCPAWPTCSINGDRKYAMRIWLDPDKLAAYRLTVQDVEDALRKQNLEVPAGRIESQQREFSVTARTDLNTVGAVRRGRAQERRTATRCGCATWRASSRRAAERAQQRAAERRAVDLAPASSARPPPTRSRSRPACATMMPQHPAATCRRGSKVQSPTTTRCSSTARSRSVYRTIAEAMVLVALVVFVFLRTLRASIIPLVTIPVSLIGAFALMALAGFTINTLTLLALVLAIGLVVDDAIVVLENIFRHIEEGLTPFQAALKGVKEIGFAVVAMTLTLAAVYRAAGVHAGPHRAPVRRVRADAGRRGDRLGLRRADADADDVQQAAAPQPEARTASTAAWRRVLVAADRRATRARAALALLGAAAGSCCVRDGWSAAGGSWWLFSTAEERAVAAGGPRRRSSPPSTRPTARRSTTPTRYLQAIERIGMPLSRSSTASSSSPATRRCRRASSFLRTVDWDDAQAHARWSWRASCSRKFNALPGVTAFPITPPSLGQGFRERPVNFVISHVDSYENLAPRRAAVPRRDGEEPRLRAARHRPAAEQARDLHRGRPRHGGRRRRQRRRGGAHASRPCSAAAQVTRYKRDADQYDVIVQTERARPHDAGRHRQASSCAAATTRWCRCRRW